MIERIAKHVAFLLIGLAVLAGVYAFLATLPLPNSGLTLLIVLMLAATPGLLSLLWVGTMVAMVILGAHRKHPGLIAAPFVFCAIWFSASVWDRYQLAQRTDPTLSGRTIPAELRSIRTLTLVEQGEPCCGSTALLADHVIDRFVHAEIDQQGHAGPIRSTELAAAKDCSEDELRRSAVLQRSGRTDVCLKTTTLDAIPDGLVIRIQPMQPFAASYGCCNVGTINVRQAGEERVAATWHYGQQTVVSYLPLLRRNSHPTPLWKYTEAGPRQAVEIGGPAFSDGDLAAAVYGIDWKAPPKFAEASNVELSRRAQQLAQTNSPNAALDIALQLQGNGYVDDDLIRAVSRLIRSYDDQRLYKFWHRLDRKNKGTFIEAVIAQISDPTAGGSDYVRAAFQVQMHREELSAYMPQAEAIFSNRHDLNIWQYEMALRLAKDDRLLHRSEQYSAEQRQRFRSIEDDMSDAFTRRVIAFSSVYFNKTDEEREFLAHQLDRVPDKLLHDYLTAAGWNRSPDEASVTAATRLLREQAATRIAGVQDVRLRRDLQEWFRPTRN
ncbi:hypothetical protein JQ616_12915 [Bradyrhizobium tropiciagri]|uniref:hypothetical protein n=1 Tax=Bradyrhizobium tropiciagri TaxID=312253 RepID=UPI001BA7CB00|nr:hypothetical protein [Bradyrhizobium tropiciagri]MBR0895858.1 hypothetical protein [Bradyrhizobium tropiciagri]